MDLGLQGKVALVTGAGSQIGFGKAIALNLAKEGCDVVSNALHIEGAQKTTDEIITLDRKSIAITADISKKDEVKNMVERTIKEFGKIDILVNNAGAGSSPKPFIETTEEEWDRDIDVNLKGMLNCTKAVLPHMIERKSGKIVNFSSTVGVSTMATGAVYGAAKAGIINFTGAVASEVYESGISVNCIAPGLGASNFHAASGFPPQSIEMFKKMEAEGKTITPQDIANAVAFLASDAADDIVGQCLRVAGDV